MILNTADMSELFFNRMVETSTLKDVVSNGVDKWYAVGGFQQGSQVDSVLLVEISQLDHSLTFRIFTHSTPGALLEGRSIVAAGNDVFIGAVTEESAWTSDGSWSKMLFFRVQPSDFSVTFKVMLGKTGVHDSLDEIAVSSDGAELYFNSA